MLPAVGRNPLVHAAFDIVLVIHQRKRPLILSRLVARLDLDNDAGIGPLGIAGGIGHAVQDHGAVLGRRRDEDSAGAHAE